MNTKVKYKTPTFRNRYGQYDSLTFCDRKQEGYNFIKTRISLVWFNRMGWYYSIEFEAKPRNWDTHKMIIERDSCMWGTWKRGPELPLCAEAGEKAALALFTKHKLTPPKAFNPFELHVREGEMTMPGYLKNYAKRLTKDLDTK